MSTVGDILSTVGVFSTVGDTMINVGDILSTVGGSVPWGDIMSTVGVILSTVGDVQHRGGYHEYRGGCSVPWGENPLLFEYPTVLNTPHSTHDIPPQVS